MRAVFLFAFQSGAKLLVGVIAQAGAGTMSDVKLQAAKELIQAKDYDAARGVLKTMPDNVTAVKWLAKLDQLAPAPAIETVEATPPVRDVDVRGRPLLWGLVLIAFLALVVVLGIVYSNDQRAHASSHAAAESSCSTMYTPYSTQWQTCVDSFMH